MLKNSKKEVLLPKKREENQLDPDSIFFHEEDKPANGAYGCLNK